MEAGGCAAGTKEDPALGGGMSGEGKNKEVPEWGGCGEGRREGRTKEDLARIFVPLSAPFKSLLFSYLKYAKQRISL